MTTTPVSKKVLGTSYVLSAVPVLLLLMSGVMKIMQTEQVVKGFTDWPAGSAVTIGIVELACTLAYLVPRTTVFGALLLTGYLGGATAGPCAWAGWGGCCRSCSACWSGPDWGCVSRGCGRSCRFGADLLPAPTRAGHFRRGRFRGVAWARRVLPGFHIPSIITVCACAGRPRSLRSSMLMTVSMPVAPMSRPF